MPETIVVMTPNWLGDAVMALPAIGAVRHHYAGARLVIAARASTAALFRMVSGVDGVVTLEAGGAGLGAAGWAADARALADAGADVAILLPNSFRSAWTARQARIPQRWGFAADLRGRLLTRRVARPRGPVHQSDYYLALTSALGMPPSAGAARIAVPAAASAGADRLLAQHGVGADAVVVGLAPGAAYGRAKQWPPSRFGQLARLLRERLGAVPVLVGSRADRPAGDEIGPGAPVVDLIGATDLPLLVGVMARCRAFVSNDSGAMHLAAAVGLPVTAVFGSTDERATSPLAPANASAPPHEILTCDVWCRPCMLRECPIDHRCMTGIDPGRVCEAVERQVGRRPAGGES
jgi:lipopolysaccharide heptosyltransferase II